MGRRRGRRGAGEEGARKRGDAFALRTPMREAEGQERKSREHPPGGVGKRAIYKVPGSELWTEEEGGWKEERENKGKFPTSPQKVESENASPEQS